jgi:thiazole synthase ThiGH ThiG subunit/Flp pilus assembly protein TadD
MATFQATNTNAIEVYEKGLALINQERYQEAIAAFDAAIKLKPNVAVAWISRGVALERLGNHAEALASHEQAIKLEPNNFLAWYNKGIQLQELGRYQEAIVAHDHALKLHPNDIDTLYNLGVELEKVDRYPEALASYDQVLRQVPEDSDTWHRRGMVLDSLGRYAEAVESYDRALNLNPHDKTALNHRSLAQSKIDIKAGVKSAPMPETPATPKVAPATPQGGITIGVSPQLVPKAPPVYAQVGGTSISDVSTPPPATNPAINPTITPNLLETPDLAPLVIAGRTFTSRLMTGTGKYRNIEETQQSILASGCQIVTVAVRRVQANTDWQQGLAQSLDWTKLWMLPNTAGCQTAEEAVRVARLGREMAKLMGQEDNNFVKLEVIPDAKYLLPDPIGTLEAAEILVNEGFAVLPYINADPILAERLQAMGCATLMPLGSPIGSGQGIKNAENIAIIIENAVVPVVVDAGIGTPSEAAQAMEMGADALLVNTAIAQAQNPAQMAQAMAMATIAGRLAYLAGRIPVRRQAQASSPIAGTIK